MADATAYGTRGVPGRVDARPRVVDEAHARLGGSGRGGAPAHDEVAVAVVPAPRAPRRPEAHDAGPRGSAPKRRLRARAARRRARRRRRARPGLRRLWPDTESRRHGGLLRVLWGRLSKRRVRASGAPVCSVAPEAISSPERGWTGCADRDGTHASMRGRRAPRERGLVVTRGQHSSPTMTTSCATTGWRATTNASDRWSRLSGAEDPRTGNQEEGMLVGRHPRATGQSSTSAASYRPFHFRRRA